MAQTIPQELWDDIVDVLHDSPDDLKSCSLVCRAFVARAQSHVFGTISIGRAPRYEYFDRPLQAKWLARLIRLVDLMKCSSPHLISYVHTLDIESCDAGEILILMAQIPWSRVRTLSLRHIPVQELGRVLDSVHMLVSISSLQRLRLESGRREWSMEDVHAIFTHCSPTLVSLEIVGYGLKPNSLVNLPTSDFALAPSRRKIRDLRFWNSPSVVDLLNHPACPFDCSSLSHVRLVWMKPNPTLNGFLHRTAATIQSLHIAANQEKFDDLDLASFPAVHRICIDLFADSFAVYRLLVRWPTPERISSICVITSSAHIEYLSRTRPCGLLDYLDYFASKLPSLYRVEIEVSMTKLQPGYRPSLSRQDVHCGEGYVLLMNTANNRRI
ncbi:hypothetical protein MSAN_00855200 [Mycena sanguinolenta]|uniref:F-box domain-containing protein n=1 Tax=Mycena sanguinolenta TaxID=230812 RepID=A0A8H6YZ24_9AGAR|nr:hypothetical protein MSAN_00855200 [Mycena sanguinolenta]